MQENVRFFDAELHKNAYFSVCKVHKIAKSVISMMSKGLSKKGTGWVETVRLSKKEQAEIGNR